MCVGTSASVAEWIICVLLLDCRHTNCYQHTSDLVFCHNITHVLTINILHSHSGTLILCWAQKSFWNKQLKLSRWDFQYFWFRCLISEDWKCWKIFEDEDITLLSSLNKEKKWCYLFPAALIILRKQSVILQNTWLYMEKHGIQFQWIR